MAAASRAVSTSGSVAIALVDGPARSIGAMGQDVGWLLERWPGFAVGGHGCSRARGAVAGGGRSALPSGAAGVGPYLDPAPRCGVSSQVGGLIARLLASQSKGDRSGAARVRLQLLLGTHPYNPGRCSSSGTGAPPARAAFPTSTTPSTGVAPVESS